MSRKLPNKKALRELHKIVDESLKRPLLRSLISDIAGGKFNVYNKTQQACNKTLRVLTVTAKLDLDAVEKTLNTKFRHGKSFERYVADRVMDMIVYDAVHKVVDEIRGRWDATRSHK